MDEWALSEFVRGWKHGIHMRPMKNGRVYIAPVHKITRPATSWDWERVEEVGERVLLAMWEENWKKDISSRLYTMLGKQWLRQKEQEQG